MVPPITHRFIGSSSSSTPIRMVDIGPTIPTCAASPEPMRSIAIMTSITGTTVHAVALNSDSHSTSGATANAVSSGRKITNWAIHSTHATLVANPTKRSEPRRCTSSPLYDKYSA